MQILYILFIFIYSVVTAYGLGWCISWLDDLFYIMPSWAIVLSFFIMPWLLVIAANVVSLFVVIPLGYFYRKSAVCAYIGGLVYLFVCVYFVLGAWIYIETFDFHSVVSCLALSFVVISMYYPLMHHTITILAYRKRREQFAKEENNFSFPKNS